MSDTERGYTITRTFHAPRELVWRAWTEPAQFARWFGGGRTRVQDVAMDVRPGGRWQATMVLADGTEIHWYGRFDALEEPQRLVMAFTDGTGAPEEFDFFTVTLTEVDGRTEMTLRQSGGHLTDEEYEQARQGTASFLDEMAALLADELKMRHDT
ncbi:MAG: SRPBCC family protein [Actinomycetota bacterium]